VRRRKFWSGTKLSFVKSRIDGLKLTELEDIKISILPKIPEGEVTERYLSQVRTETTEPWKD
jgi:hypothetical protein